MEHRTFGSIEEECHYWKELAKLYRQEKIDCQKEFEDFTDESRQLEQELETSLIQNEKQIRDLNGMIESLRDDNESLRQRLAMHERDSNVYETKLSQLNSERDTLKTYIRELEQKNDDLERTNRVVSESVSGFEAMLNQAYEKNAMLEMEIDEKEQMQINLQRLMDEARDLKQELKIRNISVPQRPAISAATSPSKDSNVSKLNDLNDSKNNNLSLNASLEKISNTSALSLNNSSSLDTTLHNVSLTAINAAGSTRNSLNDSLCNKSSSQVLKYESSLNGNPIAASTRVSALNIVADLLKKLDNLEAKLKSWKTQKSPAQRLIEATASYNNNDNSCSIDSIDIINKNRHKKTQMHQYFYEDQVYHIDKKGSVKFGLVVENEVPSDGEYENHSESEKLLREGELRVVWYPDGKDEIVAERNVGLADRTLMPGDVVRRMTNSDTQRGYCREIHVKADLKIIGNSKYVIKDVSSERLVPLVSMPRDNAVCLDSWVGSTKNIDEKLTLRSTCGSVLELRPDIEYFPLKDKNNKSMFSSTLFYVGQTLVGPVSELENAKWITQSPEMRTSRKHKTDRKFIVQSVDITGCYVHWQCKASCEENSSSAKDSSIPKSYITGEDLKRMKRLNLFESCMLQINDKNYLEINESDLIVRKSQWKKEQSNKYRILNSKLNLSTNQSSTTNEGEHLFDNQNIMLTKCDDEQEKKRECDRSKLCPSSQKFFESDEWQTEEEDEEVFSDSGTTASSCSSNPTPKGSPKKSPLLSHKIRKLKKHKQRDPREHKIPQVNDRVVTEALVVYSWATVVWQDGSIESDISSVDLCPIHHLDDHEFFPADFVLAANDAANMNQSYRDYGVIQRVDHLGRIAKVKWFSTYTNIEEPTPLYKGESEVSVYDLKDHPDFQYRPGTIVIRVANFPTDNCSTAGQVVDNYPEGRVKVWFVDGTMSMCWPQDLFEVGQYDAENNFWGNGGDSDDESWQTEDEFSEPGGMPQQQHLTANLERARKAMARLEELFIINPNLQSQEVMKKLLMVYKKCRYLDRLMSTSFFHESNFMGLVERVRKSGSQTTAERLLEKKNRLFNEVPLTGVFGCSSLTAGTEKAITRKITLLETTKCSSNSTSREDNSSYCSFESTKSCFQSSTRQASQESPTKRQNLLVVASEAWNKQGKCNLSTSSDISSITDDNIENHKLSSSSSPSSAYKTPSPTKRCEDIEKNSTDSGILITLDNGSMSEHSKQIIETSDTNSGSFVITVCAKLCSLIKMQLVKALQEINNRYCPSDTFKEIVDMEMDSKALAKAESEFEDESSPDEVKTYDLTAEGEATNSVKKVSNPIETLVVETCENFQIFENVPSTHKFHLTVFHPTNAHAFFKAVQREHKLLRSSLPFGVWVRSFEDRLDLLSVLIEGPKSTPYEDGLFAFDIQLGHDYPISPPMCHFISYCSDRLNPNLYEDGKVCVSLLGTWAGKGSEVWCPNSSTLLQVIVSIQGLILVDEPYYNEAGYEKQRGTQQGKENSRMYNEMVVLKLVQSMTKLIASPPEVFKDQIHEHFRRNGEKFYQRIRSWMELSEIDSGQKDGGVKNESQDIMQPPGFPLIPASRGFCLTLVKLLECFLRKFREIDDAPSS